jgi:hypothetical protein
MIGLPRSTSASPAIGLEAPGTARQLGLGKQPSRGPYDLVRRSAWAVLCSGSGCRARRTPCHGERRCGYRLRSRRGEAGVTLRRSRRPPTVLEDRPADKSDGSEEQRRAGQSAKPLPGCTGFGGSVVRGPPVAVLPGLRLVELGDRGSCFAQKLVLCVEAVDHAPRAMQAPHSGRADGNRQLVRAERAKSDTGIVADPMPAAAGLAVQSARDREPTGGVIWLPVTCARTGITELSRS